MSPEGRAALPVQTRERRSGATESDACALHLWIEGVEPALSVRQVSVREQLSDLFSVTLAARSPRWDVDLEAMLFRPATLTIARHAVRTYTGLCASAE